MGASRKLQGEIDRVLKKVQEGVEVFDSIWNKVYDTANANQKEKFEADLKKEIKKLQRYRDQIKTWIQSSEIKDKKVSASYEQALMDARKLIEREMERFKICEKETKTKAFSKEGLGQQPKADPKEKAKSETRDWLNNVVGELESQIDNFEAEIEGLSVKKRTRPPRLIHLETSIARHKAHIMKLELILRLLDNDELSPEQVNDVKDFLEDYVERNQEDFEEFHEVDELYSSLPLDKVESLEDLVTIGTPSHSKVTGCSAASNLKASVMTSPAHVSAIGNVQQSSSIQEHIEDAVSQESNADNLPRSPSAKNNAMPVSVSSVSSANPPILIPVTATQQTPSASVTSAVYPGSISAKCGSEIVSNVAVKEDGFTNISARKASPVFTDSAMLRSPGGGGLTNLPPSGTTVGSGSAISSSGPHVLVPHPLDAAKRNIMIADEKMSKSAVSPLSDPVIMPQTPSGIPSADSGFTSDTTITASRSFSPSVGAGIQWRPGSSFHPQSDMGQFRGRTEIASDQREKFLQRLQQVQQVHGSMPQMPPLSGVGSKNLFTQQQTPPLTQASGLSIGPAHSQSSPIQPQANQHALLYSVVDPDASTTKVDEQHHQHNQPDDSISDSLGTGPDTKEGDSKTLYGIGVSGGIPGLSTEPVERFRDTNLSQGQLLQTTQTSEVLGGIGRRSAPDLGAIGDSLGGNSGNSSGIHDHLQNLQMLESAYYKLPQPKDSERLKTYIPRHPAVTPPSYPQVQAPIVNNPAFWERLGVDPIGLDNLFFAFYYQQNTYQQYLAAKELKRQSWRYHRKYNTWFQRHEEPKVATDEYEQGTYVYFDFHVPGDDQQHGWCQRIKTDFAFEYSYLEDELIA